MSVPLTRVRLFNDGMWPFTEHACQLVCMRLGRACSARQGVEFLLDAAVVEASAFLRAGALAEDMRWSTWRLASPTPVEVMLQSRDAAPLPVDAVLCRRTQPPAKARMRAEQLL